MTNTSPASFTTYGHVLYALEEAAMALVRRVAADRDVLMHDGARNFSVLSAIVRRSIAVSMHLQATGVIDETPLVPRRSVMSTLDAALDVFADHKIDADTYRAQMEADIDAEEDDHSDIPGRPAAALVAELCRDLGMVAHDVPAHWLDSIPNDIRLLAARAAAAALRPATHGSNAAVLIPQADASAASVPPRSR